MWDAVSKAKADDSQTASLRTLISSVFDANQELKQRLQQYDGGTAPAPEARASVPPAMSRRQSSACLADFGPKPPAHYAISLPAEYLRTGREELESCRLHHQHILIEAASDSHSAAKQVMERLKKDNSELHERNAQLMTQLDELQRAVHDARFGVGKYYVSDEADMNRPSTPRPRIPFDVQPRLGVCVRRSTDAIVQDVCTLALRQEKQVHDLQLRNRRLNQSYSWMSEPEFQPALTAAAPPPFWRTIGLEEWASSHHFLRTPRPVGSSQPELDATIHFPFCCPVL